MCVGLLDACALVLHKVVHDVEEFVLAVQQGIDDGLHSLDEQSPILDDVLHLSEQEALYAVYVKECGCKISESLHDSCLLCHRYRGVEYLLFVWREVVRPIITHRFWCYHFLLLCQRILLFAWLAVPSVALFVLSHNFFFC